MSGGLGQRKELLVVLGYRRHANLDARAVWWVNVFIVGLYEDLPTLDNENMKMPTDSGMEMVCPPERYRGAQRAIPSPRVHHFSLQYLAGKSEQRPQALVVFAHPRATPDATDLYCSAHYARAETHKAMANPPLLTDTSHSLRPAIIAPVNYESVSLRGSNISGKKELILLSQIGRVNQYRAISFGMTR